MKPKTDKRETVIVIACCALRAFGDLAHSADCDGQERQWEYTRRPVGTFRVGPKKGDR